jgi:hypothetical protein
MVSCSATDARGNTGTATFTVDVTGVPIAITAPPAVSVEASDANGAVLTHEILGAASANGGASGLFITRSITSLQFPLGETIVTWTATDARGQTASATQLVVVRDTTAPSLTMPADISMLVEHDQSTGIATFPVAAVDAVDAAPAIACSPVSGSAFPLGTTTVSCTATDASANHTTATFTVTVTAKPQPEPEPTPTPKPAKKPVITVTKNVKAEATGPNGAVVTYEASATDALDGSIPVTCAPASGSLFPLGKTAVSCVATNSTGKTDTATINVNVRDTQDPEILSVTPSETSLPNGAGMVPVTLSVAVRDIVDQAPMCLVTKVTSNIKDADLNGVPDWQITGPLSVSLEAATKNNRNRNYRIVVKCTDASGNASVERTAVVVAK